VKDILMDADSLIGMVLGTNCTLQRVIGQGEVGVVFLAHQLRPDRQVAVKVLLPIPSLSSAQYTAFLQRFQHEIDAVASLKHPNIIQIYECGEYEDMTYLIMPYVNGGTLRDEMEREGPFTLEKALSYLEQIAAALDVAHEHGVIHGNVQPANILLQPEGHLVLTDFGLVKVIYEGNLAGSFLIRARMPIETLDYMAPEQVVGGKIGTHADIYSLGVVLYQMLTGTVPFQSSMVSQHQYAQPCSPRLLRPDLPVAVEQVMLKALAARPANRYMRAGDFFGALRQALHSSGILLDPANSIPASVESIVTDSVAPASSLDLLAQMVSQASAQQDNQDRNPQPGVPDLNPQALAQPAAPDPRPQARKNRQETDVIKKTSFTLPSMSGFWKHPFSLLPVVPGASSPARKENVTSPPTALSLPNVSGASSAPDPTQEGNTPPPSMPVSLPSWAWPSMGKTDSSFASQPTLPHAAIPPQPLVRVMGAAAPSVQPRAPFLSRKWALPFIVSALLLILLLSGIMVYASKSVSTPRAGIPPTLGGVHITPVGGNGSRGRQNGVGNGNGGGQNGAGNGNVNGVTPANTGSGTRSFQVGAHPLLVINGHGGDVNIQAGSTSIVMVTARQQGNINGTGVQYTQANDGQGHDRITITTNPGAENVDYDITVPGATQVQVQEATGGSIAVKGISGAIIDTSDGNLTIENVHGPVNVHTENGDITGGMLVGSMVMEVGNGGSIRLNNVNGSLKAVSHSGDVVVSGAVLNGTSILETNYGSVRFEGSVDPQGTYTMKTLSGNVSLILPNNTAFQLATSVGSGSVQNDFGNTVVGYAPRAQITATIGSGSVTVNKAV
jgi:serine/threonine protein kinase